MTSHARPTSRRRLLSGLGAAAAGSLAGCLDRWNGDGSDDTDPGDGRTLTISEGVLHVDGEPLIPTGVYFWPDAAAPSGRNPFEVIADYGLTAVTAPYRYIRLDDRRVPGQPGVDQLRADADRLGLYFFLESPPPGDLEGKSDDELAELFGALTDRVAGSPHFLGWAFDEPAWRGIDLPLASRATDAIRTHPVDQLIYFIYAPVDRRWTDPDWPDMAAYSAHADVVGHTFYPVDPGLPWEGYIGRHRLEDYGWYTDRLREWVGPETPVWLHQQAHRPGDLADPPTDEGRRPTRTETRFMTFQALAHGASGIFYFPGSKLGGAIPYDAPVWDEHVRETAAAVGDLAPALASTDPTQTVTAGSPAVRTLVRRHAGSTVVLAVCESGDPPGSVRFEFSETREATFSSYADDRTIAVTDGSFTDAFDRYEVTVYRGPAPD